MSEILRGFVWEKLLESKARFPATFSHTVPLGFKLLPKFIFQCYRHQTWHVPVLFISGIHEVSGILKFNVGSSHLPTQT